MDRTRRTGRRPRAPAAGSSPGDRVPCGSAGARRDAPHHRARRLRSIPERQPDRRSRTDARLHRVPQAVPGSPLRRHRSRPPGRERPRRAAERRLVARSARHCAPDRLVRHHDGAARRTADHARVRRRGRRTDRRHAGDRPRATCSAPISSPARCTTSAVASRLGRARDRPFRVDADPRRGLRLRHAVHTHRPAVASGAAATGRIGARARAATARRRLRAEQPRLDSPYRPRSDRDDAHHHPRRGARRLGRRHPAQRRAQPVRAAARDPCAVPDRCRHFGRRRLAVRAPPQHQGLPLRRWTPDRRARLSSLSRVAASRRRDHPRTDPSRLAAWRGSRSPGRSRTDGVASK